MDKQSAQVYSQVLAMEPLAALGIEKKLRTRDGSPWFSSACETEATKILGLLHSQNDTSYVLRAKILSCVGSRQQVATCTDPRARARGRFGHHTPLQPMLHVHKEKAQRFKAVNVLYLARFFRGRAGQFWCKR